MALITFPSGRSLYIPLEVHVHIIETILHRPGKSIVFKKKRKFCMSILSVSKAWCRTGKQIFYGGHKFINRKDGTFYPIWNNLMGTTKALIQHYTVEESALGNFAARLPPVPRLPGIQTLRMEMYAPAEWPVLYQASEIANTVKSLPDQIRDKLGIGSTYHSIIGRKFLRHIRCWHLWEKNICPQLKRTAG
jgi:hypothetical protein